MNPFKKEKQLLPVASINSVYIDDIKASDLFRPALIFNEIIQNREELGITKFHDSRELLALFNELLFSDLDSVKAKAHDIAEMYGDRLAKVLSTLYKPSLKSISNRKDWTNEHWNYWKTIKRIYLVGGLTSPILTKIFYDRVALEFSRKKIDDIQVIFFEGSSNLGTKGLSTLIDDGDYLLFDFGQTNIKRARHIKMNHQTVLDAVLPSIKSDYLFYKTKTEDEVRMIAKRLHEFIIQRIIDTINETDFEGSNIYMAIANYVYNGAIYKARGGYAKLAYLSDNYQDFLTKDLSNRLNKKINVTLYHDTSAMALVLKDKPNTAVISLGTAFGVAFPE